MTNNFFVRRMIRTSELGPRVEIVKFSKSEFGVIEVLLYSSKSHNFYSYYSVTKEDLLVLKKNAPIASLKCLVLT